MLQGYCQVLYAFLNLHGVLGFYRVGMYLSDEHMGVRELVEWWDRKGRVMEDGRMASR